MYVIITDLAQWRWHLGMSYSQSIVNNVTHPGVCQTMWCMCVQAHSYIHPSTHPFINPPTHLYSNDTQIYIYIYIYIEREREIHTRTHTHTHCLPSKDVSEEERLPKSIYIPTIVVQATDLNKCYSPDGSENTIKVGRSASDISEHEIDIGHKIRKK